MSSNGSRPIGELTRDLSEQTATLVRKELALATAEVKEKGRHAGFGAGLFGAAGAIAFFGLGALVATAILGLAQLVEGWIAAAIVTAALFAAAGLAAMLGRREVQQVPPIPEQARETVSADIDAVKRAAKRP